MPESGPTVIGRKATCSIVPGIYVILESKVPLLEGKVFSCRERVRRNPSESEVTNNFEARPRCEHPRWCM